MEQYIVTIWAELNGKVVFLSKYLVDATDHADARRRIEDAIYIPLAKYEIETQLLVREGGIALIHVG